MHMVLLEGEPSWSGSNNPLSAKASSSREPLASRELETQGALLTLGGNSGCFDELVTHTWSLVRVLFCPTRFAYIMSVCWCLSPV